MPTETQEEKQKRWDREWENALYGAKTGGTSRRVTRSVRTLRQTLATNKERGMDDEAPVCVICGEPWEPAVKNRCECGGFCTWGPAKGAQPSSWNEDGSPKMPPRDDK